MADCKDYVLERMARELNSLFETACVDDSVYSRYCITRLSVVLEVLGLLGFRVDLDEFGKYLVDRGCWE